MARNRRGRARRSASVERRRSAAHRKRERSVNSPCSSDRDVAVRPNSVGKDQRRQEVPQHVDARSGSAADTLRNQRQRLETHLPEAQRAQNAGQSLNRNSAPPVAAPHDPRQHAAPASSPRREDWQQHGSAGKPNVGAPATARSPTKSARGPVLPQSAPAAAAPPARTETVEDRRRLARSYVPSTASTGDGRTPVLAERQTGVLGSGELYLASAQLPHLPRRPPTPVLLPMTGAALSPLSPEVAHLSPDAAPFSFDDYVSWLYAPPTKRGDSITSSKTRGRSTDGAVLPSTSPAGASLARAEPLPATAAGIRRDVSSRSGTVAPVDVTSTSSRNVEEEEIRYDRSFSVSTNWAAVLAAPPLVDASPRPPSLLATSMQKWADNVERGTSAVRHSHPSSSVGPAKESNSGDATQSSTPTKHFLSHAVSNPVVADEANLPKPMSGSTGVSTALSTSASQQNSSVLSVLGAAEAVAFEEVQSPSPKATADTDEGTRAFVKHFQHGKVHARPPWFLCSELLNNCEHPYYVDWLDELDLGSVEEELARARAAQCSVLGDAWQPQ